MNKKNKISFIKKHRLLFLFSFLLLVFFVVDVLQIAEGLRVVLISPVYFFLAFVLHLEPGYGLMAILAPMHCLGIQGSIARLLAFTVILFSIMLPFYLYKKSSKWRYKEILLIIGILVIYWCVITGFFGLVLWGYSYP